MQERTFKVRDGKMQQEKMSDSVVYFQGASERVQDMMGTGRDEFS